MTWPLEASGGAVPVWVAKRKNQIADYFGMRLEAPGPFRTLNAVRCLRDLTLSASKDVADDKTGDAKEPATLATGRGAVTDASWLRGDVLNPEVRSVLKKSDMENATPANWYADPAGRHQLRYWNGQAWTEHVSDAGHQSVDHMVEAGMRIQPEAPPKRETFKEGFQRRQDESKAKLAAKQATRQEEQAAKAEDRIAAGARRDVEEAKAKMRVRIGAGREIKKLPGHLWEEETVELLSSGTVGTNNGLLALTSHRLIFLFTGLVNSAFEDFPISNISSISYKSGILVASIEVYASGNKATITNVNKLDAKEIADAIRGRLGRPAAAPRTQHPARMRTNWLSGLLFVTPES